MCGPQNFGCSDYILAPIPDAIETSTITYLAPITKEESITVS